MTGEFISRDPLEYVDGMSLYRGYFVPGAMDPSGTEIEHTFSNSDEWGGRPILTDTTTGL